MEESDDPIPKSDEEFDAWLDNFIEYAKNHLDELPITAAEIARLESARDRWKTDYAAHLEAEALATKAELEYAKLTHRGKIDPRERMDGGMLPIVKIVAANPQLQELTKRHAGEDLRKIMRREKNDPASE